MYQKRKRIKYLGKKSTVQLEHAAPAIYVCTRLIGSASKKDKQRNSCFFQPDRPTGQSSPWSL